MIKYTFKGVDFLKIIKKADEKITKNRIITEEQLVQLFATDKQKNKYKSNGNVFSSSNKTTIMKQAKKLCDIEDLGNKNYRINYYYKYPVPKNFEQMNDGVYKFMIPLILINLVNADIYGTGRLTFTYNQWYKMIELINDNYTNIKQNINWTSESKDLSSEVLYEYFNKTDQSLIYYFKKSMEYLKDANLFDYKKSQWVCIREVQRNVENEIRYNEFGEIKPAESKKQITINYTYRAASNDELVFIRKCEQDACEMLGVDWTDPVIKYYSEHSKAIFKKVKELLLEKNIMFVYTAYDIISTEKDIERCNELLCSFNLRNTNKLAPNLSKAFSAIVLENANKRQIDKVERRFIEESDIKKIMKDFKKITSLTIGNKSELLSVPEEKLTQSDIDLINSEIENGLFVKVNGSPINIKIQGDNYETK